MIAYENFHRIFTESIYIFLIDVSLLKILKSIVFVPGNYCLNARCVVLVFTSLFSYQSLNVHSTPFQPVL